ncbi:hypothetical protein [Nonlabens agnitus]|nr:hypothetical protein [Nonlabens agnitus]
MKKILLFMAACLMLTTAQAMDTSSSDGLIEGYSKRYKKVQPVLFTHNFIDFALYPDGRLEFNIPRYSNATICIRPAMNRRRSVGVSQGNVRYNRLGQLTLINNTRVSYNRDGTVARIGRLDVDYYRGILDRVGGLEVRYDKKGRLIAARGHVDVYADLGRRHDCASHNFGHFDDGYARNDWDDGVYFKRAKIKK